MGVLRKAAGSAKSARHIPRAASGLPKRSAKLLKESMLTVSVRSIAADRAEAHASRPDAADRMELK